jgi:hypothetical protein
LIHGDDDEGSVKELSVALKEGRCRCKRGKFAGRKIDGGEFAEDGFFLTRDDAPGANARPEDG